MSEANRGTALKTGLLVAILVAASVFLGLACARTYRQYSLLFRPGPELVGLAVWVLGSIVLVVAAAGLVVALVRPFRVIAGAFGLSAIALGLAVFLQTRDIVAGAPALIYAALAMLYARSAVGELNSRLRFSIGAIKRGRALLVRALIVFVCISFGLGYRTDATARGFIIPPVVTETIEQTVLPHIEAQVGAYVEASSSSRGAALRREKASAVEAVSEQFSQVLAQFETALKACAGYVWVGVSLILFSVLSISQVLLSWVPTLVLSGVLLIFSKSGVARTVTETAEVKRLVLS